MAAECRRHTVGCTAKGLTFKNLRGTIIDGTIKSGTISGTALLQNYRDSQPKRHTSRRNYAGLWFALLARIRAYGRIRAFCRVNRPSLPFRLISTSLKGRGTPVKSGSSGIEVNGQRLSTHLAHPTPISILHRTRNVSYKPNLLDARQSAGNKACPGAN